MPPRVTLAMLAEKDAPTLGRCLDSCADLVDEVVIVTDPDASAAWKAEIAGFDARLVEFDWRDDFSAGRDAALRNAGGDWIFYLDADEWLDETNRDRLSRRIDELSGECSGYRMRQVSRTALGRVERLSQVRLFRNLPEVRWRYRLHEQVTPALHGTGGAVGESDIEYLHDGYQDRRVLERKRRRNFRLLNLDLRERPDDPFVLFNAGIAALDIKRPADAAKLLDRSRRLGNSSPLSPSLEVLYSGLARALSLSGNNESARRACEEGLRRLPENPELLFVLGTLLFQAGDGAAAERHFEQCLRLRPTHGLAWQVLGDLYLKGKRFERAEALAGRLTDVPGMDVDAAVLRSRVLLATGRHAASRCVLEAAIARTPTAILLHELYANVLIFLRDHAAAQGAVSRLLTLDPEHGWAQRQSRDFGGSTPATTSKEATLTL